MKVALVYDRVNKWGGAERVLLSLHKLFPEAPLFTSVYNPETAGWAKVFTRVIPSFLQKFPYASVRHDFYAPLMPLAFESFDFSGYDLVISVTSEAAKGIITKPGTVHISYCLTPTRYLWSGYEEYIDTPLRRKVLAPVVGYLQRWDQVAAQRPDVLIAISKTVQQRIEKYYGRESVVIYPPVTLACPESADSGRAVLARMTNDHQYYLVVSRLVPYKKVDLVVQAFNVNGKPLIIVGTGSEEKRLRLMAKGNIKFTGFISDTDLSQYYKNCKALIFPQEEDFGIVSVEAQSFGKPVIAHKSGGVVETVTGKTGMFFERQTAGDLLDAIQGFEVRRFAEKDCINNAKRFSEEKFLESFAKMVDTLV
ncbi:MAG: glycosyltransferase [Candidatus Blackburnbacteria bacterium]|nr:glycosyltransferase [Candidatus Blackburnbacteria bacterium]